MSDLCLVADVGGTNTRVALAEGKALHPGTVTRYPNDNHGSLAEVLDLYCRDTGARPNAASVAVAGPVRDGHGRLTNRDWEIDRASLARATGATRLAVLNDLQAQGHALAHLGVDALQQVLPGQPASPQAARLVIGVGTGMNAAPVYRLGERTLVPPAEAGHMSLPAQNSEELRLLDHVARHHGTPGLEEVLSGRGVAQIYAWLADEAGTDAKSPQAVMESLETDPLAQKALTIFIRFLGRAAGNLALVTLPFGGVYLIGGVARRASAHFETHGFAQAFRDKGRFTEFMDQFPVHIVTDDYAALIGCAAHLAETAGEQDQAPPSEI